MNDLKLILVRGLPGSGKSTIARSLSDGTWTRHLETDMYWINTITGEYEFVPERIKDAHLWCQKGVDHILNQGYSVAVSNTFTQKWELQPYFEIAKKYGIIPQVILCQNQFKNIHNVPEEVLVKMKDRFEYDISELFED